MFSEHKFATKNVIWYNYWKRREIFIMTDEKGRQLEINEKL